MFDIHFVISNILGESMSEPHSPKPQPNSPQVSIQNSIQNFISETGPGYVIDVSVNEITFTTDSSNASSGL